MNADFWTEVSSIGQAVSTILAILALIYSIRTFNKSVMLSHYGALDQMYADLLKLAIEKPYLRAPSAARTPEEQQQYEIYAHLAWCFVETVHDHSLLNSDLMRTWRSAIEIEERLHRDWLERPANRYMFKDEFHNYIASTFPRESTPQVGDRQ